MWSYRITRLLLVTAILSGCGGGSSDASRRQAALVAAVDDVIVPGFVAFEASAERMEARVRALEATPSAQTAQQSQRAFEALSSAWNRVSMFYFGPLNDDLIAPRMLFIESMRQRGVDYTATVREARDVAALKKAGEITPAYVETLRFNQVGLLALEVLLYEGRTCLPDAAPQDAEPRARTCEFLGAQASVFASRAQAVAEAWTVGAGGEPPFAEQMSRGRLEDGTMPLALVLGALADHLEYLRRRKLMLSPDAQLSGRFYDNLAAAVDTVEQLLVGDGEHEAGLLDLMRARGFSADAEQVVAALGRARSAAAAGARSPLTQAVAELESLTRREIPTGLGIDLGLTFSDGD